MQWRTGAAPVVWLLTRDPYRSKSHLAVCAQNQLGRQAGNLAFEIEEDRLMWCKSARELSADEAAAAGARSVDRHERRQAGEWLLSLLAEGPIEARLLWEEARQCHLSERTVRRAAAELGLHPKKAGQSGPWLWGFDIGQPPSAVDPVEASEHEDEEHGEPIAGDDSKRANVAAFETVGSLGNSSVPTSAVVQVELRREAPPTLVSAAENNGGDTCMEARRVSEAQGDAAASLTSDTSPEPSPPDVATFGTDGSLPKSETARPPSAKSRRLREKLRRERKAIERMHSILRDG